MSLGPWVVRKRWFTPPWGSIRAITLYPFIFLRAGWPASTMRHELIHVWQIRKVGWFRFYLTYLWDAARVGYGRIPVELEAWQEQHSTSYLPAELEALAQADRGKAG